MIKTNGQGFPDDINLIATIMQNGGLTIHPTDTLWVASAALPHAKELDRIPLRLNNTVPNKVLFVKDIAMLKQYIVDLHPRIETLLSYLERPVIILGQPTKHFPDSLRGQEGKLACSITRDPFCIELIKQSMSPIAGIPLIDSNKVLPLAFEHIMSHLISSVDYVSTYGRYPIKNVDICPVITYDKNGNIQFIRE